MHNANINKIIKIRESLLKVFTSNNDKKIIIKKALKENIKCLFMNKKVFSNEKDKMIPIISKVDIKIKFILSISFHHSLKFKLYFINKFFYDFFKTLTSCFKIFILIK